MPQSELTDYQNTDCIDHTDAKTLRKLYWDEGLSAREIAEMSNVTSGGIVNQMENHNIQRRSHSKALSNSYAGFETSVQGYERWRDHVSGEQVKVHRLVAVAQFGFDKIKDKHIHHKNGIRWDNRPSKLEPLTPRDHQVKHNDGEKSPNSKLSREQARKVKSMAENGEKTHQEIADRYDVARSLVTMIKSGKRWPSLE